MMKVDIGKQAPEFEFEASNGKKVKLSDFRGKHVVLYFYLKDMTPGCTTESCGFRDRSNHSIKSLLRNTICPSCCLPMKITRYLKCMRFGN